MVVRHDTDVLSCLIIGIQFLTLECQLVRDKESEKRLGKVSRERWKETLYETQQTI